MPAGMGEFSDIPARSISSRISPRVGGASTPSTSFRLELASASTARMGCFAVLTQVLNHQTGQRGFSDAALSGYSNNLRHSFLLMLLIGRHPVDFLLQCHYTDCQQINNNQILEAVQKQNSFQNLLRKVSYFAAKRNQHQRSPDEVYAQCHSEALMGLLRIKPYSKITVTELCRPGRHQPRNLLHPLF